MHPNRRGFTLIEVALAVSVGLVIMAASVFAFQQVTTSTKFQQAKQMVATIQTNIGAQKFRTGTPESIVDFRDGLDGSNKPYWPDSNGGFPADPITGTNTVTAFDSTAAAVALQAGDPAELHDNPVFLNPGHPIGGWLYDPNTGAFRINLSNKAYPEHRPSQW